MQCVALQRCIPRVAVALNKSGFVQLVHTRKRSSTNPAIRDENVPKLALVLGGSGLLPFLWYGLQHEPYGDGTRKAPWGDEALEKWSRFLGVSFDWAKSGDQQTVRHHMLSYGATILSFLGAVHWGVAMVGPLPGVAPIQFVVSVIPSLWGWSALVVNHHTESRTIAPHVWLSGGFLITYLFDEWALTKKAVPAWYTFLRTPLTVSVVGLLTVAGALGRETTAADRMRG